MPPATPRRLILMSPRYVYYFGVSLSLFVFIAFPLLLVLHFYLCSAFCLPPDYWGCVVCYIFAIEVLHLCVWFPWIVPYF